MNALRLVDVTVNGPKTRSLAAALDLHFPSVLAAHRFTPSPESSEISEPVSYVGGFSARTAQIRRNVDRREAAWRSEHPGEDPVPRQREAWDRREKPDSTRSS